MLLVCASELLKIDGRRIKALLHTQHPMFSLADLVGVVAVPNGWIVQPIQQRCMYG
jgi:hypothetical protein